MRIRTILLPLLFTLGSTAGAEPLTMTSVGSDTLGTLMLRWALAYQDLHSDIHLQIQTPGSASAVLALTSGAADLGPMSRPMSQTEEAAFRDKQGLLPQHIRVALDAVAVFVHPDNPLTSIRIAQLDGIYASDRGCPGSSDMQYWSDLGVSSSLATRPVLKIGRNTASGSYEFFREIALCNGDYRAEVVQFPGASAIVAAVAKEPAAIGYAGISYVSGLIKVLPVGQSRGDASSFLPDPESIRAGRYPLSRPLYIYFNPKNLDQHATKVREFLNFVLSDAGQAIVSAEGLVPMAADELAAQRRTIE
ncbi:MAG: phosphate ABC transporter substrate-binding protein [Tahibacter sp.]